MKFKIKHILGLVIALFLLSITAYAVSAAETTDEETEEVERLLDGLEEVDIVASGDNSKSIINFIKDDGNFTIFYLIMNDTCFNESLCEEGPLTLFAPMDTAFAAIPEETLETLLEDKENLRNILLYHFASGELLEADIATMNSITTLQGSELPVSVTAEGIMVDDAKIIIPDIETNNGVIHAIDAVMIPPVEDEKDIVETAAEVGIFETLLAALEAANLTESMKGEGPFTVFAPTDEAFEALPEGTIEALLNDTEALKEILLYHVAAGELEAEDVVNLTNITTLQGSELPVNVTAEGIMVDDAKIIIFDIEASNGVIHAIDAVMIPPVEDEKDIVEIATEAGNFNKLLAALEAADLTGTLKGEGPFTVFAPTDEAFEALPEGTIEALLNDTEALKEILLYHVAAGELKAEDVVNLTNITTLQGSELPVNVTAEGIMVDDAKIIISDIEASNGVIHAIDAVMIPPEKKAPLWYFFSIPQKAKSPAAEELLADVNYDLLLYYNTTSRLYEDVTELEPLKGYWIRLPTGNSFNATDIFEGLEPEVPPTPAALPLYPGWNAIGSPVHVTLPAEAAFTSIDACYTKVIGPWVPKENGYGSYSYVGYNGQTGILNGNQVGTDNFSVDPYEGYWVYVLEECTLA